MFGSFATLRLGRLFGIEIAVSWIFVPILALLVTLTTRSGLESFFLLVVVLGSVLLHELGHALVAQHFGIHVRRIKFWLLGGVAELSHIPENPRVEGLIALAGPAVNFLLALASLPLVLLGQQGALPPAAAELSLIFFLVNLLLGALNLLPAFPMDGGRLLRAGLATRMDWLRATELAVRIGRWVALFLAVIGIVRWSGGWFLLPLIAIYVWWQGALELVHVRLRHGVSPLGGIRVQFGGTAPFAPPPEPPVREGFSQEQIEALERYPGRLRRDGGS